MGDGHRSSGSGWTRSMGNVRSFFGNMMGGLRGGSNVASWTVAATLAYFIWVKPSQDLKRQQQERVAAAAASAAQSAPSEPKAQPQPQAEETRSVFRDNSTKSSNS